MPKMPRTYNNNTVYPMGGITQKRSGKDVTYPGIRPAMKKGPQPTDMGTTSARSQAKRFYKGAGKEGN